MALCNIKKLGNVLFLLLGSCDSKSGLSYSGVGLSLKGFALVELQHLRIEDLWRGHLGFGIGLFCRGAALFGFRLGRRKTAFWITA